MLNSLSQERAAALDAAMSPHNGAAASHEPTALARYVAECFESTVCLAVPTNRGSWQLVAAAPNGAEPPTESDLPGLLGAVAAATCPVESVSTPLGDWTIVRRIPAAARPVLLVAGDWRLHAPILQRIHRRVAWPGSRASHQRNEVLRTAVRFSRRVARVTGTRVVCTEALAAMTALVDACIGSIALVDDAPVRCLTIVATHGYSPLLVERVRIDPGEGLIGRVFATGQPLYSASGSPPQLARRLRYETDHFVAVPLRSRGHTIGVMSAADPFDGQPFTGRDVSSLQALGAPAATAIDRERVADRADAYADAAAIDAASGLFNRRYFAIRIEEELQRSRRHVAPVTLLIADLDNFKAINDTHGHLAGDEVIRDIADILRGSVRVFDVCARFGGEEFAVIMPATGVEGAMRIAERVRDQVSAYRPADPQLTGVAVTFSIGIAVSDPGMSARQLIGRADDALYDAKRAGKNRVCVAAERDA